MNQTSNIIGFPGLGIESLTIEPTVFSFGNFHIAWYGIIITLGMIAGFFYALYRAKFENISVDDVLDLALYGIVSAVVGARLYYVLFNLDHYKTFYDVIAVWNGGLAIYGGIIAAVIAVIIISKIKKIKIAKNFDMVMPAIMLGQIIGRWGNFVNAEAYGSETILPWRMAIYKIGSTTFKNPIFVHPTFLYESLWNLIGFILINIFYKKKRFDGQIALMYFIWYGTGRALIEGLRTDSLMVLDIRVSQLVSVIAVAVSLVIMVIFSAKHSKKQSEIEDELIDNAMMIDNTNAGEQMEEAVRELPVIDDFDDNIKNNEENLNSSDSNVNSNKN